MRPSELLDRAATRLISGVLFPLHEVAKKHHSVALRRQLERTQWLPPAEIEAQQLTRLRNFLAQVALTVPYYRQVFARAGFRPDSVAHVRDLAQLPFLTKSLIRENCEDLKAAGAGRLIRYNTGGSTGEPLVFFMGAARVSHDVAAKWRATRWWGVDIGDCEIVLWGSPIELGKQDRIKLWRDRLLRSHLLPAFQMSERQMDLYLERIVQLRPRMLFGYASALALLATHAQSQGRMLHDLELRVAFATGETLYPAQREIIERVFGCPVANGYGSRDGGFIAHQCPQGSLHLSAEHIVVELVDAAGQPVPPGEVGEIVVTHLATADFPLIRYRTGDMAARASSPCSCGRGLPVLEKVLGRSTDFIRTPAGNIMHALALIYEVREKPGVRAFKFIQAEDLSLELLVVAGPELTADIERQMIAGLMARMGAGGRVQVTRVAEIPPEKSGKYRYVVSRASDAALAGAAAQA
jgi:phenylacetate-coenzyme A ligase PaaK-like adenylate-forming protein